jgi:hypothetical protein
MHLAHEDADRHGDGYAARAVRHHRCGRRARGRCRRSGAACSSPRASPRSRSPSTTSSTSASLHAARQRVPHALAALLVGAVFLFLPAGSRARHDGVPWYDVLLYVLTFCLVVVALVSLCPAF